MAERPNAANRAMAKRPLADTNCVISEPVIDKGMNTLAELLCAEKIWPLYGSCSLTFSHHSPQFHRCPPSLLLLSADALRKMFSLPSVKRTRSQWWRNLLSPCSQILLQTRNPLCVLPTSGPPHPWRRQLPGLLSSLHQGSWKLHSQTQRRWLSPLLLIVQVAENQRWCLTPQPCRGTRRIWWKTQFHLLLAWSLVCRGWQSRGSVGMAAVKHFHMLYDIILFSSSDSKKVKMGISTWQHSPRSWFKKKD